MMAGGNTFIHNTNLRRVPAAPPARRVRGPASRDESQAVLGRSSLLASRGQTLFNPVCKAPTGRECGDLLVRISRLMRALSELLYESALSSVNGARRLSSPGPRSASALRWHSSPTPRGSGAISTWSGSRLAPRWHSSPTPRGSGAISPQTLTIIDICAKLPCIDNHR